MSSGQRVLVFGATSAICQELLKIYAFRGASFYLLGRDEEQLEAIGRDLAVRGGGFLGSAAYNFNDWERHDQELAQAVSILGQADVAIVAHGSLPDQSQCEISNAAVKACIEDNFSSAAMIIHSVAQQLSLQGHGTLAVLSSVAGDRGRKSNYTYGAAKAGIDTLLEGMRGRFSATPVNIVNIKPGLISTPMTAGMKQGLLWSTPEKIAPMIFDAISRGKSVCYVPGYWRLVMLVIRWLPAGIMARLPI